MTQFLEEITTAIKSLKEENDIKVLFAENGYVEDPNEEHDLSILKSKLESLSVSSNNSFVKESDHMTESSMCDNAALYNSPISLRDVTTESPTTNNISFGRMQKKSLLNEKTTTMEPIYSPYYYKMMKK